MSGKVLEKKDEIKIPEVLQKPNFNFCLIKPDVKTPLERAWQKKIRKFDDPILLNHLKQGNNYGVQGNGSFIEIDGQSYFLVLIDFDKRDFQDKVLDKFPKTFMTTSGSSKNCVHLWLASNGNKSFKILDEKMETLCDVLGEGKQLIAPGSIHTSGSVYKIVDDSPIAFMPYSEIEAILKPHDKRPKKERKFKKPFIPKNISNDVGQRALDSVSVEEVLSECGVDTSKNPTECPFHSSVNGKCFLINDNGTFKCFHCDESFNKYSLLKKFKGFSDKETFNWFAEKSGLLDELEEARKDFVKEKKQKANESFFSLEKMIDAFLDKCPLFYDRSKLLWKWDFEKFCYEQIDITDLRIALSKDFGREKNQILGDVLERARLRIPKDPKKTWVQFKSKVYDFETGEIFKATPKYFFCNPIPFDLGKTEDTPTIDKLFQEWVGEDYVKSLKEISATMLTPYKFMQRIFAFIGGGRNGKTTYSRLMQKCLGKQNYTTTELKTLSERNFETSILHKKLLAILGEVNYDDLKNTGVLKSLSGEDEIRFEFKGKDPFSAENTASILILTNALPSTPDRSHGFYRRFYILNFPNKFEVGDDPLEKISDSEISNFLLKCYNILKELYKSKKFDKDISYDQREVIYEQYSNPIIQFLEESFEDTPGKHTPKKDFIHLFNSWLRKREQRPLSAHQITSMLKKNGYDVGNRKIEGESCQVIIGISEITQNTQNTREIQVNSPTGKTNSKTTGNLGNLGKNTSNTNKSSHNLQESETIPNKKDSLRLKLANREISREEFDKKMEVLNG